MKRILYNVLGFMLKLLSVASAVSLFICFLSIYISPAKIWFFAYFGLLFQFIFLINTAFLIVWTVRRKMRFTILHLIAFVPNMFFAGYFFKPFGSGKDIESDSQTIKLLSYNVQGFRIPYQKNTTQEQIADFINSENADIVCLQEFYTNSKVTEELFEGLIAQYKYHSIFYSIKRKDKSYGIATFSRYPIKMTLEIPFDSTANAAMYSDIEINNRTVRVYNVHFQSIKLNINKLISGNKRIDEIEEASSRLKTAFIKRAGQADKVAKHINVSPHPVIICGDFNDTPISYTYNKIKGNRKDTFCEAGKGMPSTYRLSLIPS
ncbi:MAG: endonuclease/exonuclease/phosphatase family protein, partial [Prevotellaceae bacterium]|nr:endonuclease/exonuclease/phosphatase family protein [Prevotellaceae bacterium]